MRRLLTTVAVVTALVVASTAAPTIGTAQTSHSQSITECTTITDPGVYTLGTDITNATASPCLDIESSAVVVDGNGHTLTGDGDGVAVNANQTENRTADGHANVTVRDLTVDSWGTGLNFVFAPNATATDLTVTETAIGVQVGSLDTRPGYETASDGAMVRNSTFEHVESAVRTAGSNRIEVVDNAITTYETVGIRLDTVNDAIVSGNDVVATAESGDAIQVRTSDPAVNDGSSDNVVASNRIVNGAITVEHASDDVTNTHLVDNEVVNGSIAVGLARGVPTQTRVANNTLTHSDITVSFASAVTIEDNVLTNPGTGPRGSIALRNAGSNTVRNNTISGAETGVVMSQLATDNTITANTITDTDVGVSLRSNSYNNTIEGNTLADNAIGVEVSFVDSTDDRANDIRGNDIMNNTDGIFVRALDRNLVVEGNDIRHNEHGITLRASAVCSPTAEGAAFVAVHDNRIANNTAYGVLNQNADVVNATSNYWGASDGPSSAADVDAPFADPETGTLANGSGAAVSEDPNSAGQSNVHFDAWLQQAPEDVGADNQSAA
ncbi:nitrous oxide reductase family maturation protein NosD [Haloferax sp. KTX1]|uniref:right-handed parallel beta-helix repeat-containing protein n=1 Tax=Haloferax sp. KTX1 TaxID=2600597 RepID=UPI0011DD2E22|nr:NosD domain-containing protein [Haloferax sp. KTX1]